MQTVLTNSALVILASLGVMQAADILVNGSIFESLRNNISRRSEENRPMFKVLNQLFTCMLCMCTQAALWLTWIPASWITYRAFGNLAVSILSGFVAALAIAGLALGIWMLFQYSPRRFHDLKNRNLMLEKRVRGLSQALTHGVVTDNDRQELRAALSIEVLGEAVAVLNLCNNIGCSIMRAYCLHDGADLWFRRWVDNNSIGHKFVGLEEAVFSLFNSYFRATRGYPADSPRHEDVLKIELEALLKTF